MQADHRTNKYVDPVKKEDLAHNMKTSAEIIQICKNKLDGRCAESHKQLGTTIENTWCSLKK